MHYHTAWSRACGVNRHHVHTKVSLESCIYSRDKRVAAINNGSPAIQGGSQPEVHCQIQQTRFWDTAHMAGAQTCLFQRRHSPYSALHSRRYQMYHCPPLGTATVAVARVVKSIKLAALRMRIFLCARALNKCITQQALSLFTHQTGQ